VFGLNPMFVSLLQLMGFPTGKAVHSRASENSDGKPERASQRGITVGNSVGASNRVDNARPQPVSEVHAQASSARRQEVKAKPGKAKVPSKAPAKAQKAVASAKSVKKPAAKPAGKAAPKAAAKAKPVAKSAAKPVAKPVVKAKPQKPAAKTVAKPVAKPAAKPAKAVPAKPVKPVKVAKAAVVAAKPTKQKEPKGNVKESAAKVKPVAAAVAAPVPVSKVAPAPVSAASAVVPPKAGRPSSRLASLTVPSMAQSVASTAAKASYTQTVSSPLIIPPLPSAVKKDPKLANNWKTKPANQLTDAELMAMPDSEYMNDVQMAAFRQKLVVLKQDILSSAGETTEHLREDTVVVPDPADRATIEEEHALELRTRDRERKLLKKIEQSIGRIDAGDYGYCDETGEPIGVGRLLARPTATLSLEAQQRRELKQKMFGD
jgi:DnaK suppressor protein